MPFVSRFIILMVFTIVVGLSHNVLADHRPLLPESEKGDDGMHKQPWFHESFLNLADDLSEAAESGKRLLIMWEQKGCPYCEKTHKVNLRNGDIVDYLNKHFVVVQLNLWGDREVTDLDGKTMTEKEIAIRWGVRYTPTLTFLPETPKDADGKSGKDTAVHTLFGYFYPFHFMTTLQYVVERGYETEPNFQRFLIAKGRAVQEKGGEVDFFNHHLPVIPKDGKPTKH